MTKTVIKPKLKKRHLKTNKHFIIMLWVSEDLHWIWPSRWIQKKPHKWGWHQIFTLNLNALDICGISLYMLFNIYYWIQCGTLNNTWHINIFLWKYEILNICDLPHGTTFVFPTKLNRDMIVSLYLTGEPKMVWIDLLNTKRSYKREWYHTFILYFKFDEILSRVWHGFPY